MLKKIRITFAIPVFTLLTLYFLQLGNWLPEQVHSLAHLQFIPALLGVNIGILIFLLLVTFLFGRIYCSVICPMGVLQDVIRRFSNLFRKKKKRHSFRYAKAKKIVRYGFLAATILAIISGFGLFTGIIDPYSAYGRIITHLIKPVYISGNNLVADITARTGNYLTLRSDLEIMGLLALGISAVTFLVIGFMAWTRGRSYCNTICPVGTFLGFISYYSLFRIGIDKDACSGCTLCERKCKAHCINSKEHTVDNSRCVECYNCLDSCKKNAISYRFHLPATGRKKEAARNVSPESSGIKENSGIPEKTFLTSRRRFLSTAVTTALSTTGLLAAGKTGGTPEKESKVKRITPISPPGSGSHSRLKSTCTSCHLCINRCPQKVLKPAGKEYGIAGMMQPVLFFDKGYCDYTCNICTQVCPDYALKPISLEEKQNTKIGTAVYTRSDCIVLTKGLNCLICHENCPVEAIGIVETTGHVSIPYVDESRCIGCGACENICPATPRKAIYVEGTATHRLI